MPKQAGVPPNQRKVERAIVLQLLRDDHDAGWSYEELAGELGDVDPFAMTAGLARLREHGVVLVEPDVIRASQSARWLDVLGVIGI